MGGGRSGSQHPAAQLEGVQRQRGQRRRGEAQLRRRGHGADVAGHRADVSGAGDAADVAGPGRDAAHLHGDRSRLRCILLEWHPATLSSCSATSLTSERHMCHDRLWTSTTVGDFLPYTSSRAGLYFYTTDWT